MLLGAKDNICPYEAKKNSSPRPKGYPTRFFLYLKDNGEQKSLSDKDQAAQLPRKKKKIK